MTDLLTFKRFPLLSALSEEDIWALMPYFKTRHYRKGQLLFSEGEIGSQVYFVLSGQIKLKKNLSDGSEQILDWCAPFDVIAESLFLESGSYPATAEVVEEATLWVFSNEGMPQLLPAHPSLAVALTKELSRKLRFNQEFIRLLISRSTAGVLAGVVLRLAKPGEPSNPIYIDASLTNKDLANMIGTSREFVNRSLNQWKKSGIIRLQDERLEILKPYDLADWP